MRTNKTKMNPKTFFFMISSSLLQTNGGNVLDGPETPKPFGSLHFSMIEQEVVKNCR
jgi:hypothetical protein